MSTYFNPWHTWTGALAAHLKALGYDVLASEMSAPPKPELGDICVPFFRLAKELGKNPAELAKAAAQAFLDDENKQAAFLMVKAVAAGPYLNVQLHDAVLMQSVRSILASEQSEVGSYGRGLPHIGEPVIFEYANPNTHKELHIGHLRMLVTGVAFHSLWTAAGIPVKAVQFINDQGSNVAKTLWAMVKKADLDPRALTAEQVRDLLKGWPEDQRTGNALARIYVEAGQMLEADEAAPADVSWIQARLEAHDPVWEALWRETRGWCLDELDRICQELGIVFDRAQPYLESDLLDEAAQIVGKLEASAIARVSEGALIVDLEEEKLGAALIRKSDGNMLYASKDLALAYQKERDWPGSSQSYVLVDERQSFHFKQLKAILKKMSFPMQYDYLGFGLLTLKEGTMSSRKGNVITYQMLRDALLTRALTEVSSRHAEWTEAQVNDTARAIAFGGMKFALLKQDCDSIITFDMEQALAFEGTTGPYCQYAVVRLRSILSKAIDEEGEAKELEGALLPAERELVLTAGVLPKIVQQAAGHIGENANFKETQPAVLAQWCFKMAQSINAFYRDVPVLDAEPAVRTQRLAIARMALSALTNGLKVLTIDVPEMM